MIAVAAVALVAGVGGAALATVSGSTASLTRILDLSLTGHGTFAPRWSQPPQPAG